MTPLKELEGSALEDALGLEPVYFMPGAKRWPVEMEAVERVIYEIYTPALQAQLMAARPLLEWVRRRGA